MKEQDSGKQMQWERSTDFRRIYLNHINFRFAPGDGNITFSQLAESPGASGA